MDKYAGLSEDEVFALATRPDDIPGVEEWGIPHAVDTERCSPQLRVRQSQSVLYCAADKPRPKSPSFSS